MKFGIAVGKDNQKAKDLSERIEDYLKEKGHEVLFGDFSGADFIVSLGGDGTLIHAACASLELEIPVVGINLGKLGFLTACEADEWQESIQKLIDGKYFISERMTLDASIEKLDKAHPRGVLQVSPRLHPAGESSGSYRAVNEVVIKGLYRVVDLEVTVKNRKFLQASGDGVIVATQTGSTAYSLSAGGPIVDPDLDCFVLTPVNAHGLPVPSVVLSPNDEVEITIKEGENVSLIIDGQENKKVEVGSVVKINKGKHRVKLIYFEDHHIIRALNAKFGFAERFSK